MNVLVMQRRMLVRGIWHRAKQLDWFRCRVVSHREVSDHMITQHHCTLTILITRAITVILCDNAWCVARWPPVVDPVVDVLVQQGTGG